MNALARIRPRRRRCPHVSSAGAGLAVLAVVILWAGDRPRAQDAPQRGAPARETPPGRSGAEARPAPGAGEPGAGEPGAGKPAGEDPARVEPAPRAEADLDRVRLTDGSTHFGRVVDPGGWAIEIEYRGARRKVAKAEIESIEYFKGRQARERLDTDLVVLKLNNHHVRCKILRENGRDVLVELANGARTTYTRDRVERVLYRHQILSESSQFYNQDLESEILRAIATLRTDGSDDMERAEKLLVQAGVFAVDACRRSLAEIEKLSGAEAEAASVARLALGRVLHVHALKRCVDPSIEESLPALYDELAFGTTAVKESLLKVIFSRFADESVPLALYLISYPFEDPQVRAMCVEILRRLDQNRALVTLYNEHSGQLQFVAAVALARNRVFIGVPTLIEALELGSEQDVAIRQVADSVLRETTGQDFGFRADGAPAARARAVAEWRQWWADNEKSLNAKSRLVLEKKTVETIERREAVDLWKKAHEFWTADEQARAEIFLRESVRRDPGFHKASVSLATLLHTRLPKDDPDGAKRAERFAEARQILEDLSRRSLPEVVDAERHWFHYELGNIAMLEGRVDDALDDYKTSLSLDASSISAVLGIAACHWDLATGRNELTAGERKIELQNALREYLEASQAIQNRLRTVQVLGLGDVPKDENLPFARRDFNRNVLSVRESLEATSVGLFAKIARIYSLQDDSKRAVLTLREGLDTLRASTELNEGASLEIELRTMLGSTYESLGKDALAFEQYAAVLKRLDDKHEMCRRGYDRVRRRLGRDDDAVSRLGGEG